MLIDILSSEIHRGDGTTWEDWEYDYDEPIPAVIGFVAEMLPQYTEVQALVEEFALDTTKNPNDRRIAVENLLNTEALWRIVEEDPVDWNCSRIRITCWSRQLSSS